MINRVRYKDSLYVLVLLILLSGSIILQQNFLFFYYLIFVLIALIAFFTLLHLRPDYRRRLIERLELFQERDHDLGDLFYRYGRLSGILIVVNLLIFRLLEYFDIVSSSQTVFFLLFFYVQMILGTILLISLIRSAGRIWRYPLTGLLILQLAVVVIISILFLLK